MSNSTLCQSCGIHPAVRRDYRCIDGISSSRLSCEWCMHLKTEVILNLKDYDPKDLVEGNCEYKP